MGDLAKKTATRAAPTAPFCLDQPRLVGRDGALAGGSRAPAPDSAIRRSEREHETGAAAGAVFDADPAAVQFDDAFDKRESYPCAAPASGIGAPKSSEYRLLVLVGNSGALIFDDNGSFL